MAECLFLSALYLPCDCPSPGTDAVKEVCFHIQNGPAAEILTVFLVGLSTNWLTLPALGPPTLLPNGACYIDQLGERQQLPLPSTNLPFSLSPPVSPFLFPSLLLLQSVSTANLSETACFLMS